jgi:drug/metabolite transporter (DMT)-like permease
MPLAAALALLAFAANSLLCRLALRTGDADPVTFTVLRLASGAALLWGLGLLRRWPRGGTSWAPAVWLTTYAFAFSWAYVRLDAGTGALVLFGCVQLTMLASALRSGESLPVAFWVGTATAGAGVVWLVLPGTGSPSLSAALSMATAGVAWGLYSLAGRTAGDAAAFTRSNFERGAVLALPVGLAMLLAGQRVAADTGGMIAGLSFSFRGVWLAVLSGAITSGLGYVLWYSALRTLPKSRAATLQLSVPVLTALLAVPLLRERPTWRLAAAALLVLGGIGLTIHRSTRTPRPAS